MLMWNGFLLSLFLELSLDWSLGLRKTRFEIISVWWWSTWLESLV